MRPRIMDRLRGNQEERAEQAEQARFEIAERVARYSQFLKCEYMKEFRAGLETMLTNLQINGPAPQENMLFISGKAAGVREVIGHIEQLERTIKELSQDV